MNTTLNAKCIQSNKEKNVVLHAEAFTCLQGFCMTFCLPRWIYITSQRSFQRAAKKVIHIFIVGENKMFNSSVKCIHPWPWHPPFSLNTWFFWEYMFWFELPHFALFESKLIIEVAGHTWKQRGGKHPILHLLRSCLTGFGRKGLCSYYHYFSFPRPEF